MNEPREWHQQTVRVEDETLVHLNSDAGTAATVTILRKGGRWYLAVDSYLDIEIERLPPTCDDAA